MVGHHPVKLDIHSHCGSGDIMVLVCVISQDYVTKES